MWLNLKQKHWYFSHLEPWPHSWGKMISCQHKIIITNSPLWECPARRGWGTGADWSPGGVTLSGHKLTVTHSWNTYEIKFNAEYALMESPHLSLNMASMRIIANLIWFRIQLSLIKPYFWKLLHLVKYCKNYMGIQILIKWRLLYTETRKLSQKTQNYFILLTQS